MDQGQTLPALFLNKFTPIFFSVFAVSVSDYLLQIQKHLYRNLSILLVHPSRLILSKRKRTRFSPFRVQLFGLKFLMQENEERGPLPKPTCTNRNQPLVLSHGLVWTLSHLISQISTLRNQAAWYEVSCCQALQFR